MTSRWEVLIDYYRFEIFYRKLQYHYLLYDDIHEYMNLYIKLVKILKTPRTNILESHKNISKNTFLLENMLT